MPNEMMMDQPGAMSDGEMGMVQNADLKLVMTFLQNIKPGDMSPEAADQLMGIGQRIQGGGSLSDNEREMLQSVVMATDRFPTEQMGTFPQGNTNPDIMKDPSSAVRAGEMPMMTSPRPQMRR